MVDGVGGQWVKRDFSVSLNPFLKLLDTQTQMDTELDKSEANITSQKTNWKILKVFEYRFNAFLFILTF